MLVKEAMKRKIPIPDFIANAPIADATNMLYIEAFYALSSCRSFVGLAGVPTLIPWTAISQYATDIQLEGEERSRFIKIIKTLDVWWIGSKHGSVQPKDEATGGGNPKGG